MIVSLEPMRMVTKLDRKPLRALQKSGYHTVPGRNQEVSGVVHIARPCQQYSTERREKRKEKKRRKNERRRTI